MANTMSYAAAGISAPSAGGPNDETYFLALANMIFGQHNATDAIVSAAVSTGSVANAGKLAKFDGAGGLTATSLVALAPNTGTIPLIVRGVGGGAPPFVVQNPGATANVAYADNAGNIYGAGQFIAGSTPVTLTDTLGKILSAALNTVQPAQGGHGRTSVTSGSLLMGAGTGAMTEVAPGASGNILTSNGTGWISSSGISGSSFATGAIPFAKISEGAVTANGANLTLTIGAMKFNDPNGVPVTYAGGTYTIPGAQVPGTGNNAWVLVYMSANGAVGSIASAFGPTPSRPSAQPNTETLEYVYLRANATAIFNADDSIAGHGYTEGGWRNPWQFGASGGGGGSISTPVAISLGGTGAGDLTTARTNLAAAASGVNSDITKLNALTQAGPNQYFASGSAGWGAPPIGLAQAEFYTQIVGGVAKSPILSAITWTGAAQPSFPLHQQAIQYSATSIAGGGVNVGMVGLIQGITAGVSASQGTPLAATGSIQGINSSLIIQNSGDALNEYCPYYADVTFETNNIGNTNTTPGRLFMTDFHSGSAIRQRQSAFGGVHMGLANYYDGSPSGIAYATPAGTFDVSTIHASAAITGGTYTVTFAGLTTAAINPGDSIATINAKLAAAGIAFVASGGPLTAPTDIALTCTIIGPFAPFTITPTGITGGTLSIVHTTTGTHGTYYSPLNALGSGTGIENPSGAYWAITQPQTIVNTAHSANQTFPLDVGFGVVGYSGTTSSTYANSTQGFGIGFLAGSHGSNYGTPFSRLGYGMWIQDFDTAGIRIAGQHPAAAAGTPAIQIDSGAGGVRVGAGTSTTLQSPTLGTVAGALGGTATNELSLASFGYTAGNTVHLGVYAMRTATGATYATTAIGLGMDVDSTKRIGGQLWLVADGSVGIGGFAAQNRLTTYTTFTGNLTYPAIPNATANVQSLATSGLTVGDPVAVGFSPALPGGATAYATVVSPTQVNVTITNHTGGSYTPGTLAVKVSVFH